MDDRFLGETDKILIAYFTWAENAADTSGVDATTSASVQAPGNVARMAAWIQQETGEDLFSISIFGISELVVQCADGCVFLFGGK